MASVALAWLNWQQHWSLNVENSSQILVVFKRFNDSKALKFSGKIKILENYLHSKTSRTNNSSFFEKQKIAIINWFKNNLAKNSLKMRFLDSKQ
jgi:hypothetical protein